MPQYFDHLGPLADVVPPGFPAPTSAYPRPWGQARASPRLRAPSWALPGVTPERGRAVLGATVLTALALSAGAELYRWGASGLRHDASPTDDAGPSGGAKPADDAGQASGAKPIDAEALRPAARSHPSSSARPQSPSPARRSSSLPRRLPCYHCAQVSTPLHKGALPRAEPTARQTQDPQAATFDAALAAEERRLVHPCRLRQRQPCICRSSRLLRDMALRALRLWRTRTEQCWRTSGRRTPSCILHSPRKPADPHVITLSSELPAMEYLAYLARIAPAPLWGAPALAAAAATAARVRNGFLRQMPLPRTRAIRRSVPRPCFLRASSPARSHSLALRRSPARAAVGGTRARRPSFLPCHSPPRARASSGMRSPSPSRSSASRSSRAQSPSHSPVIRAVPCTAPPAPRQQNGSAAALR